MKHIRKQWQVLKAVDPKANDNTVILTAEVPAEEESAGDIVRCAGMECPDEVPLLAQHMKHAPDGSPTVLGKVSNFRDSKVVWKGSTVPAKLGDIEWADTDLAKKYRQVFPKFIRDVSIGAEVLGEPERIKGHGWDYKQSRLFELSVVTFGANPAAESVKAIKAALGDAVAEPVNTLAYKIELDDAVLDELKHFIDNAIVTVLKDLQQINKRLDDFECYLVSKSDDAEQTADHTPQAQEIDWDAVAKAMKAAAKK
jgi:hypothetical protein